MFAGKPIIGLTGGIGSGKSFIASLFAQHGFLVLDADAQARAAYQDPDVRSSLLSWYGPDAFLPDSSPNRRFLAERIFNHPAERIRLESLIHPKVKNARQSAMKLAQNDEKVRGFVWDIPLLVESGESSACDFIVFVDAPLDQRIARVTASRHWPAGELQRREFSQSPLDKKRALSHYVVNNTADAATARQQVQEIVSLILNPGRT